MNQMYIQVCPISMRLMHKQLAQLLHRLLHLQAIFWLFLLLLHFQQPPNTNRINVVPDVTLGQVNHLLAFTILPRFFVRLQRYYRWKSLMPHQRSVDTKTYIRSINAGEFGNAIRHGLLHDNILKESR